MITLACEKILRFRVVYKQYTSQKTEENIEKQTVL